MVNPVRLQEFLAGVTYPARRPDLVDHALDEGAGPEVLDALRQLPDRDYFGPDEVSEALAEIQ